jgi:DNA-binding NarL/FixJ family response regulator
MSVRTSSEKGTSSQLEQSRRILIVEDEDLVAMDAESVLQEAGFEVTGMASTAEEAIKLCRADRPDLVIMDIRLAGMRDGIDAAIDLFQAMGLRCVFATAYNDSTTRRRAEPAQPLGWLSKPYQPAALVQAVKQALARLASER